MKINFKRLKEVETEYKDSTITVEALQHMLNIVIHSASNDLGLTIGGNLNLAVATLTELGILDSNDQKNKEPQHLNS